MDKQVLLEALVAYLAEHGFEAYITPGGGSIAAACSYSDGRRVWEYIKPTQDAVREWMGY